MTDGHFWVPKANKNVSDINQIQSSSALEKSLIENDWFLSESHHAGGFTCSFCTGSIQLDADYNTRQQIIM